jgi:hypothetical protein
MASNPAEKRRRATYADVEAAPPHMVAEIIDRELYLSPRLPIRHAHVSSRLGMKLGGPFDLGEGGPGGWVLLDEPELHFGGRQEVLVPDLAGWRRERMPEVPDVAAIGLPPDWLCEVLSPSTAALDRTRKMRVYAREGVAHVWLIDPIVRTLEVFRLDGRQWLAAAVHHGDAAVRAEPFEAIELELGILWAA